jgi:hypothetical protein
MRSVRAILSVWWLLAICAQAPFQHIHAGDPAQHEAAGYVHAHLRACTLPTGSSWQHAEPLDDAIWLEWAVTREAGEEWAMEPASALALAPAVHQAERCPARSAVAVPDVSSRDVPPGRAPPLIA